MDGIVGYLSSFVNEALDANDMLPRDVDVTPLCAQSVMSAVTTLIAIPAVWATCYLGEAQRRRMDRNNDNGTLCDYNSIINSVLGVGTAASAGMAYYSCFEEGSVKIKAEEKAYVDLPKITEVTEEPIIYTTPPPTDPPYLVTLPVVDISDVIFGPDESTDGCSRDMVMAYDGRCYPLLSQGPCQSMQWLLLDKDNRGICASRLCEPGFVFVVTDQLCHDINDRDLCPGDKRPYVTGDGQVVCDCDEGYFNHPDDTCHLLYTQGLCDNGDILSPSYDSVLNCRRDQCSLYNQDNRRSSPSYIHQFEEEPMAGQYSHMYSSPTLRSQNPNDYHSPSPRIDHNPPYHQEIQTRHPISSLVQESTAGIPAARPRQFSPNGLDNQDNEHGDESQGFPFVSFMGQCYQLGTQGPCSSGRIVGIHTETLEVMCATLEEAGLVKNISEFDMFYDQFVKYNPYLKYWAQFKSPEELYSLFGNDKGLLALQAAGEKVASYNLLIPCRRGARRGFNVKCRRVIIPYKKPRRNESRPTRIQISEAKPPRFACPELEASLTASGQCVGSEDAVPHCPEGTFRRSSRTCRQTMAGIG